MKITLPTLTLPRFLFLLFAIFFCNYSMAQLNTGKGYLNITKGANGGTFEAGDVLEIRVTVSINAAYTFAYARFIDTIPANTTYIPGSLKLMTNEGIQYRGYTDAADGDGGIYDAVKNTLKIHMGGIGSAGYGATSADPAVDYTNAPWIDNMSKPSFFGNTSIIVGSYRIKIDAATPVNTVISTHGGAFYYSNSGGSVPKVAALPAFKMKVVPNLGLCTNKVARNSVLESEGTFGSGTSKNRSVTLGLTTTYNKVNLSSGVPNDGDYALVNNTTANNATNNNYAYGSGGQRVFSVWEITGDHSGTSNAAGNPPIGNGSNTAGYMLVVNASYVNGIAVQQSVNSLCDQTYYEFSAWFKNMCKYCGCDKNGNGVFGGSYVTATPGDSSGVKPNLTFEVNGESLYTSGDIAFSGQWVKKGFIFKTKPGQTSIVMSIRNNSSGGGGNDWAMDDLSLSICGPGIAVTPTMITDCNNNYINMEATVKYFEQNYGSYVWEKSTNGGSTWTTTPNTGSVTPQLVSGQYQYTVQYPPFLTSIADDGDRYRLRVAANAGNLSGTDCSYIDTTVASLMIFDCQVLPVEFLSFNGNSANKRNTLRWSTKREVNPCLYTLQRSNDGTNYADVTTLNSQNEEEINNYKYTDPLVSSGKVYYRILIKDLSNGKSKYTNIVILSGAADERPSTINVLENPFSETITLDVFSNQQDDLNINLYDAYGRQVRTVKYSLEAGYRKVSLDRLGNYAPGFYLLKMDLGNKTITRKMIKK